MSKAGAGLVYKAVSVHPVSYTRFKNKCAKHGIAMRTVFQVLMDAWSDGLLDYGSQGLMSKGTVLREIAVVSASNIDLSVEKTDYDALQKQMEADGAQFDNKGRLLIEIPDEDDEPAKEPNKEEDDPRVTAAVQLIEDREKAKALGYGKMPGKSISAAEVARRVA